MTDFGLNFLPRPFAAPALLLALMLWAAPVMAGEAMLAQTQGTAPVVMLEQDGDDMPAGSPDGLVILEDGTVQAVEQPAESKGGFPQLDVSTYSSQVFWLFVFFGLLYVLMSRMALPRVTEVLDMRQTQLNTNLDRAAQLNDEAQKAKDAFQKILGDAQDNARGVINAAEQTAADQQAQNAASFAAQAHARVTAAEAGIAKAKTEALNSLADIAADVAAEMTNKIGKAHIGKADALATVKSLMGKA